MSHSDLKSKVLAAVKEYVARPEAWEDAQLVIDPVTEEVELQEIEETDKLPDSIDVYAVMDFIEMTPDGRWMPDRQAIDDLISEVSED